MNEEVEYEFQSVASDGMAQVMAQIEAIARRRDDSRAAARDEDQEWRKREDEVDQLIGVLSSETSRLEKREALQLYLDPAAGGVVAVDRYRLTPDKLLDVFSSDKIDRNWKKDRLMFRNCRDCRAVKRNTPYGVVEMHGAEGCCWKSWYPLEYCDVIRHWPWRWHSADKESDLMPQMIMAEDQAQYDALRNNFRENTEAKFLFNFLENGLGGTDDAFMEQRFSYIGRERLDGILKKFGQAMVLVLAYNFGRRIGGTTRCGSHDPLYGLRQLEKFSPGIVGSARDCFGNDAQLYLLAGYGAASAPCDNGHDIFDVADLDDAREELDALGCLGDVKNEFGVSARELVAGPF